MTIDILPDLNILTIITDDLDELSEHAGTAMNPLGPSDRRGGTLVHMALGDIIVNQGRVNQPIHIQGKVPHDVYRFALKLDSTPGQWNGIPLESRHMLVHGPGSEVEGSGGQCWATVTIPRTNLEDQIDRRQVPWEPPSPGRFSTVSHPSVEELARQIDTVRRGLCSGDITPGSTQAADGVTDALVSTLSGATFESRLTPDRRSRWRSTEIVHMTDALLAESEPITSVGELAIRLGISQRWMREAFRLAVGTSPKQYLTAYGLRGARNDLVTEMPSESSVADVALRWGFWHLSRFAEVYDDYYGEHPSQTLQRTGGINR